MGSTRKTQNNEVETWLNRVTSWSWPEFWIKNERCTKVKETRYY